ncbi:hypothetical protein [Citricoccus nitrophenolicus]|uniref:hypothetical protein n=1 Tax=Citricoccus nitrophenolicus TaxID=863575 RepID=UPI0031E7B85B
MRQLNPLGFGLLAGGSILVSVGGIAFVLMFIMGLEAFLAEILAAPTTAEIFGAILGLLLDLVVPALLVWMGIRLLVRGNRRKRPSC